MSHTWQVSQLHCQREITAIVGTAMAYPPAWDTTAINDDPDFVDAGVFNFQLQNGSPCMDVGKNVSTVVGRDLFGVPRPQGLAFDIGAYEYITGTVTTRIEDVSTSGDPLIESDQSWLTSRKISLTRKIIWKIPLTVTAPYWLYPSGPK